MSLRRDANVFAYTRHVRKALDGLYAVAGDPAADVRLLRSALYGALALLRTLLALFRMQL